MYSPVVTAFLLVLRTHLPTHLPTRRLDLHTPAPHRHCPHAARSLLRERESRLGGINTKALALPPGRGGFTQQSQVRVNWDWDWQLLAMPLAMLKGFRLACSYSSPSSRCCCTLPPRAVASPNC